MRLLFLVLLFFPVHSVYGENTNKTQCVLPTEEGSPLSYVNEAFIGKVTNCTEWIGDKGNTQSIYIQRGVTQDIFNRTFKNVKKISKLFQIYFQNIDDLTSLVFPSLKSFGSSLWFMNLHNCHKVKTISFPVLDEHPLETLHIVGMDSLDVISIDNLMKKFIGKDTKLEGKVLCDGSNIEDVSQSGCNYVKVTETKDGRTKSTITYVKKELKIVGNYLRNLDFLKLQPLNEKHSSPCEISNNTFCTFERESVVRMMEDVYKTCTIENNLDAECKCNFPDKEYKVDIDFVREYSDCLEWIGGDEGTRIVMDNAVTQGMFDAILVDLTRISRVSLEISDNKNLTTLNFSSLQKFGEEGENITAVFTSNPKVETISFPEISKSTVHLVTRDMYSLSEESIKHLNEKFPSGEIVHYRECNFPNKEYKVDGNFVRDHSDCLEWIGGDEGTRIVMDNTVNQRMFDAILMDLTRISRVSLDISNNRNLTTLNFSSLKTFGEEGENITAVFTSNPKVETISFPEISKSTVHLVTGDMYSLSEESIKHLNEKFPSGEIVHYRECVINGNISDLSVLSNCSSLTSLQFIPNIRGNVTSSIEFVRGDLIIEGTLLENISFLKLLPRDPKNNNTCKVVNNKFCDYNETAVQEILENAHSGCVFENNIGKYCVCDLSNEVYVVNQEFLESFSNCSEWSSSNTNGSRVVMKGDWKEDTFIHVFGNLTKISGVSFEISENHVLTSLEFPKLESFGEKGQEISAEFKFNSKVQSISFPNISMESTAKIVTKGMHSLSEESIATLNGKFKNDGIAPFGVCHLREGQTFLMDRDFVRDYWNCSEWISNKSTILIDPDTILMRFRRAFSKVKKISGASIEIHQNVHLVSLLFPRIESFGNTKFTLRIHHCPRIRNISFPRLSNSSSKNLKIHIHGKNEMSKRTIKRLKFAHYTDICTFKYPISKDTMLYNCRNVTSLEFTAGLVGVVRDPVKYIDKDLIIQNTRLRDLDFLQMAPQKKKNVNNCSIVGNNLCWFDAGKLTKTVLRYYRSCTIENNLNNTSCEHYPTPKPYRPRRNLQFDSRGYYIPPKGEDWWRMPALFACSIVFLFFLCWNCN